MTVRQGEDKIQFDTVVLTFDSLMPPKRIRAGYLTLNVRPDVPLPMRSYKFQRFGHGKDRCKKPVAVCVRCGKGNHVERELFGCAASSKTYLKFLEEQAILHYKAKNGGTLQQALEICKMIFPSAPPRGEKPRRILRLSVPRE
ncbi:nucleic-acid-binding protein from mobile element jockey [Plakobranchus ocellatus]|uniref:Nucleic-acid-binding protein from mobile element jockey n=1 Tax=Plakobranchus ocellatus TaxID=259542 RepID=A0AAV3YF66_9GAST|nr:nucleic-acid-binding protein from mobile element jockey [Plakobranchus ocellatus]